MQLCVRHCSIRTLGLEPVNLRESEPPAPYEPWAWNGSVWAYKMSLFLRFKYQIRFKHENIEQSTTLLQSLLVDVNLPFESAKTQFQHVKCELLGQNVIESHWQQIILHQNDCHSTQARSKRMQTHQTHKTCDTGKRAYVPKLNFEPHERDNARGTDINCHAKCKTTTVGKPNALNLEYSKSATPAWPGMISRKRARSERNLGITTTQQINNWQIDESMRKKAKMQRKTTYPIP